MISDLLFVSVQFGIPFALLSWLLFMRFFGRGELDRKANRQDIERRVKEFETNYKNNRKKRKREGDSILVNFAVAYAGYWIGIEAARRNLQLSRQALVAEVKRRFKPKPRD